MPERLHGAGHRGRRAAMDETVTHYRTCSLCEATCGLQITTRGAEILDIRGDDADPLSGGYICPKGPALKHLHDDPDRLRHPMIRRGARWERIGWDDAVAEIEARVPALLRQHERGAGAVPLPPPRARGGGGLPGQSGGALPLPDALPASAAARARHPQRVLRQH